MATIFLETFGCQMNELDSELVRSQLRALGHRFVDDWSEAEVVLFNTCSVREHAESKAYSRLGIVGQRKKRGDRVVLGVLGCMAERDGPDLLRRYPQVDLMCGPGELDRLPLLIDGALRTQRLPLEARVALAGDRTRRSSTLAAAGDDLELLDLGRAFDPHGRDGAPWSAYVRITRGCNKFCTYCVVPNTRGAEVHRPPDHIVEECRRLVEAGVVEITLLGQTVNHYRYTHGTTLDERGRELPQIGPGLSAFRNGAAPDGRTTTFARLLRRIHDEVPALRRLRFLTSYPRDFGVDVLETLASCPRICPYVHAPVQSGSDRILKLMNRGYTAAEYRAFVDRLFDRVPNASLAGDFIVGFPTETDEDFEQSLALVRELPFKNNFIFKYSPRPGTAAIDRFKDDVPIEVKKLRNNQMLAVQAETSLRVHRGWVGRTVEVLVERVEREARDGREDRGAVNGDATVHDGAEHAPRRAPAARPSGVALAVLGQRSTSSSAGSAASRATRPGDGAGRPRSSADQARGGTITGRTSGDLIVSAAIPAGVEPPAPGSIIQVGIEDARPLLLRGRAILAGNGASCR